MDADENAGYDIMGSYSADDAGLWGGISNRNGSWGTELSVSLKLY